MLGEFSATSHVLSPPNLPVLLPSARGPNCAPAMAERLNQARVSTPSFLANESDSKFGHHAGPQQHVI